MLDAPRRRASAFSLGEQAGRYRYFCRMAPSSCAFLLPTSNRSGLRQIAPPTMPSADFRAAVRPPYDDLSLDSGTQCRPPEGKIDRLPRMPAGFTNPGP
jgi:hypothetical protein